MSRTCYNENDVLPIGYVVNFIILIMFSYMYFEVADK